MVKKISGTVYIICTSTLPSNSGKNVLPGTVKKRNGFYKRWLKMICTGYRYLLAFVKKFNYKNMHNAVGKTLPKKVKEPISN